MHQVVEPFLAIHFQFEVHPTVSCNLVDITSLINFWLFMTNETHTDAMHLLGCCTVQFSDPRCRMHLSDTKFCKAPNAAAFISALLESWWRAMRRATNATNVTYPSPLSTRRLDQVQQLHQHLAQASASFAVASVP